MNELFFSRNIQAPYGFFHDSMSDDIFGITKIMVFREQDVLMLTYFSFSSLELGYELNKALVIGVKSLDIWQASYLNKNKRKV